MWKQVNNLLGQLSPYRIHYHKRNGSEGADDAGLELSVRQATPAATELKPVIGRASHAAATARPVIAGETSTNVYADHPLEAASRHETAQPADQAPAAADFVSSNTTTHTSHDHAATRQGSTSSGSGSADTLLTCLLSQQWYQELAAQPISARLVLSMIWQLAADSSLQQQQLLLAKLRKIVDVGTWQEAFGICKDALVLRCVGGGVCASTGLIQCTLDSSNSLPTVLPQCADSSIHWCASVMPPHMGLILYIWLTTLRCLCNCAGLLCNTSARALVLPWQTAAGNTCFRKLRPRAHLQRSLSAQQLCLQKPGHATARSAGCLVRMLLCACSSWSPAYYSAVQSSFSSSCRMAGVAWTSWLPG
jgi:hypothetical protein